MLTCHGGLTPPALGGSAVPRFADKTAPCAMHKRIFSKSGGHQPAVRTKRICNGASFSRSEYVRAPRLAYASRSRCTESVDRKITTFAVHKRTFPRAAGVSPPWSMKQPLCGENPTLGRRLARRQSRAAGISLPWERNESAMARVFPGASTFAHHGGLTPPAPGARSRSTEK
jgi:hypothetical protein